MRSANRVASDLVQRKRPADLIWQLRRLQLCCGRSVTPGQELVDAGDLVVGDPAEHVGEPSLRIDAIQLGALDQSVGDRRRLAAAFGADEEIGGMTVLGGHPVRPHIEL